MISSISGQCRQCGGTASVVPGKDHLRCDYCQSMVLTSDNPLAVDQITPLGDLMQGAECPVCLKQLQTGSADGRPVLFCSRCLGLLIRSEHFGAVVRERRSRREGREGETAQPIDQTEYRRRVNCPSCLLKMEVHPYYGPGNVVIDSCHRCEYIWLDHGELRSVEMAAGGTEPKLQPLHVNSSGEITTIPDQPVSNAAVAAPPSEEAVALDRLLTLLFGF